MTLAVVVIAYNRPAALRRLLGSLAEAFYPAQTAVPLVISIDRGAQGMATEVVQVAHDFEWRFGPKSVLEQPQHRGVVGHFRAAGRLSQQYGDGVVLLEDDLTVAPLYYDFASMALARYQDDDRVAAVCLYGLWFNGFTHDPFVPVEDGSDVFFLKLPYTQGVAFSDKQWQRLDEAWGAAPGRLQHPDLHPSFRRFGPDEWFPDFAAYLAANDRFVCFPRVSLSLGWGDAGAHFAGETSWLQTPLQLGRRDYHLPDFDSALAVYDSFFEILPDRLRSLGAQLPEVEFDVDLYATKSPANLHQDLVLTIRPVRRALAGFGLQMRPPELNVARGVPGDGISLARREDVYWDRIAGLATRQRLEAYHWARHRRSRKRALGQALAGLVQSLRRS